MIVPPAPLLCKTSAVFSTITIELSEILRQKRIPLPFLPQIKILVERLTSSLDFRVACPLHDLILMEGPSLVIAREELKNCIGSKVKKVEGTLQFKNQDLHLDDFVGEKLNRIVTWGKHFILEFKSFSVRVHFLLFGSYTADRPKPNRNAKLALYFSNRHAMFMYACSVKKLEEPIENIYDWRTDLMSSKWDAKTVLADIRKLSQTTMACDVLMNQMIFTGLGNIMKNEVLYRTHIHPEKRIGKLSKKQIERMVDEAHIYAAEFYKWKKKFELKKHWLIMRKKLCPKGHPVINKMTGEARRMSHFCKICQPLR